MPISQAEALFFFFFFFGGVENFGMRDIYGILALGPIAHLWDEVIQLSAILTPDLFLDKFSAF